MEPESIERSCSSQMHSSHHNIMELNFGERVCLPYIKSSHEPLEQIITHLQPAAENRRALFQVSTSVKNE